MITELQFFNFSTSNSPEGKQCSICYQNNGELLVSISHRVNDLYHWFHQRCINTWLSTGHRNCPECESPIQAVYIPSYGANEEEGEDKSLLNRANRIIEIVPPDIQEDVVADPIDEEEVQPIEGMQIVELVVINPDEFQPVEGIVGNPHAQEPVGVSREEVNRVAGRVAKICVPFVLTFITGFIYFLVKVTNEGNYNVPRNGTLTWYGP